VAIGNGYPLLTSRDLLQVKRRSGVVLDILDAVMLLVIIELRLNLALNAGPFLFQAFRDKAGASYNMMELGTISIGSPMKNILR